jgi:hypothetical protein
MLEDEDAAHEVMSPLRRACSDIEKRNRVHGLNQAKVPGGADTSHCLMS